MNQSQPGNLKSHFSSSPAEGAEAEKMEADSDSQQADKVSTFFTPMGGTPSPNLTLSPLILACRCPLQAESKDEAEKPSESAEKSGGDKTEAADKVKKEGGEASEREEEESEEGGEAKSSAPSGNC